MKTNEVKIIAVVFGGKEVAFDVEELTEILEDKELYKNADNLPKWMRFNGGFPSWKAVWETIARLAVSPGTDRLTVRSDFAVSTNRKINAVYI